MIRGLANISLFIVAFELVVILLVGALLAWRAYFERQMEAEARKDDYNVVRFEPRRKRSA